MLRQRETDSGAAAERPFFHPLSGLTVLGLDWLIFGTDVLTGWALIIPISIAGGLAGGLATGYFQRALCGDTFIKAGLKALLGALAVGIPLPIGGTFMGGLILGASGLGYLTDRRRSR